jgi:ribonuclease HI
MSKKKYYVVWKGYQPGIYPTWDECKKQVEGFSGAKYKSFPSLQEAEKAFKEDASPKNETMNLSYIEDSLSVDAACSGNPGQMEYKGVYTKTGETIFHFGPILGTNNIGEFLAIVHGLAYLREKNSSIPIYSDSQTAIQWVKMKKANTTLAFNQDTKRVWGLIERAEKWLQNHSYENKLLKWDTEKWGEIKADFGRK